MKRTIFSLTLISILISCISPNPENSTDTHSGSENLLQENSIKEIVALNHNLLEGVKGDFPSFKVYLNSIDKYKLSSIPFALDYISTCIVSDNADWDSIYLAFDEKFYSVIYNLSDSLDTKYKSLMELIDMDFASAEVNAFKNNLLFCGVEVFSSEGSYYLDVSANYFYDNFKNRVSDGIRTYLDIRKDELKQGFSEDAGLLISFDEVYHRGKRWEKYLNDYPNSIYSHVARSYYQTYLGTLMTGMDNSRVFDFDSSNTLMSEIKTLYEKIIKEEPESKTSKIISSYYAFLAKYDFKETDSITVFLKENNLTTMLAVQPHLR